MSGDEDTLDLELRSLTLQLQQVQLEQERLERKLKRVQAQLRKRDQQRGQEAAPAVSGEQQAYLGKRANTDTHVKIQEEWVGLCRERPFIGPPQVGDKVRILNPKAGQVNIGTITGYCSDGKLKILTLDNVIVTRWTKNVNLLQS